MKDFDFNDDMQSDELDNKSDSHFPYHPMYCLKHGWIMAMTGLDGHFIVDENFDVEFCEGLLYSSEPPQIDPDFDLQEEPNGDELFLMNLAAEELMFDLGVK